MQETNKLMTNFYVIYIGQNEQRCELFCLVKIIMLYIFNDWERINWHWYWQQEQILE